MTLRLTWSQLGYVNKAFWRNPPRAFFTFVFPLMFLVIFTSLLGNDVVHLRGMTVKLSTLVSLAPRYCTALSATL